MKIKSFLRIIQGHQITDEEIYLSIGKIPILTSKNEIKGYWNKALVTEEDLPCITYPTKANTGEAYVQTEIFDANNTAVMIPFPEWREKLNLHWLCLKLSALFLTNMTSKEGVSYLNKEIVEEIEIEIPKKEIQDKEYAKAEYLLKLQTKLAEIQNKITHIKNSPLTISYKKYQIKSMEVSKIFDYVSGNSGLTEEYIYSMLLDKRIREYKVLTGSVDVKNVPLITECEKPKNPDKKINIFAGEGLHIVRKGKAGNCTYLPPSKYTLNDDAYILKIKNDCEYKISLKWLANTQTQLFASFASQSDNSTWNMTGFFEEATLDIPAYEEQLELEKKFAQVRHYEEQIATISSKINTILTRELF
jgi:hypothetical protein